MIAIILRTAWLLPIVLLWFSAAFADEVRRLDLKASSHTMIPRNAVFIANAADQPIEFLLAGRNGPMEVYKLEKGDTAPLSDGESTSYTIEVSTAGRDPVRYQLSGGHRYKIYWSLERNRWDLIELMAR